MKSRLHRSILGSSFALGLVVAAFAAAPVFAQDVGVSISVGQPGFYGRIDIGNAPPPRILYREPRIVEHVVVVREPIYLRVPPGHARHWSRHCHEYDACGQRVYFVQDDWYTNEYAPYYREHHERADHDGDDRGHDNNHDSGRQKGHNKGHKKNHKD